MVLSCFKGPKNAQSSKHDNPPWSKQASSVRADDVREPPSLSFTSAGLNVNHSAWKHFTRSVSSSADSSTCLLNVSAFCNSVNQLLQANCLSIAALSPTLQTYSVLAATGPSASMVQLGIPQFLRDDSTGKQSLAAVFEANAPLRIDLTNTTKTSTPMPSDWQALSVTQNLTMFHAMPIMVGHRCVGAISVAWSAAEVPASSPLRHDSFKLESLAVVAEMLFASGEPLWLAKVLEDIGQCAALDDLVRVLAQAVADACTTKTYTKPHVRIALVRSDGCSAAICDVNMGSFKANPTEDKAYESLASARASGMSASACVGSSLPHWLQVMRETQNKSTLLPDMSKVQQTYLSVQGGYSSVYGGEEQKPTVSGSAMLLSRTLLSQVILSSEPVYIPHYNAHLQDPQSFSKDVFITKKSGSFGSVAVTALFCSSQREARGREAGMSTQELLGIAGASQTGGRHHVGLARNYTAPSIATRDWSVLMDTRRFMAAPAPDNVPLIGVYLLYHHITSNTLLDASVRTTDVLLASLRPLLLHMQHNSKLTHEWQHLMSDVLSPDNLKPNQPKKSLKAVLNGAVPDRPAARPLLQNPPHERSSDTSAVERSRPSFEFTTVTNTQLRPLVAGLHNRLTHLQANAFMRQDTAERMEDFSTIELLSELGAGGFGIVYRGIYNGVECAIKVIRAEHHRGSEQFRDAIELAVLSTISHPHIVQVMSFFPDASVVRNRSGSSRPNEIKLVLSGDSVDKGTQGVEKCIVIIMEYCDKGSLLDVACKGAFKKCTPQGVMFLDLAVIYPTLLEVAMALRHLHTMNLVHCDVKASNVLLRSMTSNPRCFTSKLSDFGLVRVMQHDVDERPSFTSTEEPHMGTVTHMAPEMLYEETVTSAVDIYAFGVMMWEIAVGQPLYTNLRSKEIVKMVIMNEMRPAFPAWVNAEYQRLAKSCWSTDPTQRPTANALVAMLRRLMVNAGSFAHTSSVKYNNRMSLDERLPSPEGATPHVVPMKPRQNILRSRSKSFSGGIQASDALQTPVQ